MPYPYRMTISRTEVDGVVRLRVCRFMTDRYKYLDSEEHECYNAWYMEKYRREKIVKKTSSLVINHDYQQEAIKRANKSINLLLFFGLRAFSKFLTLTYAVPCFDRTRVKADMGIMCKRFLDRYGKHLGYLSVLELHPGGHGYHVHIVVNCQYISQKDWQDVLWQQGIVDIRTVRSSDKLGRVRLFANYLSKYLQKDAANAPLHSRRFNVSHAWPKLPFKEFFNYASSEAIIAYLGSLKGSAGAEVRDFVCKLRTGEQVHILEAALPATKELADVV